jgi:nucleotide-binding universal stress UspA family protein
MKTALIAIDDSDAAIRALQYAMEAYDGIHIINVQVKAEVPIAVLRIGQEELDNMQLEHGRSQLVPARKLLVDAARPYREHVLIGDPAGKIVEVAKAEGVDAIVMGTRGMRALGNLALGSTSTKVIHLADLPVTLVK